jgi:hypothetical protein
MGQKSEKQLFETGSVGFWCIAISIAEYFDFVRGPKFKQIQFSKRIFRYWTMDKIKKIQYS